MTSPFANLADVSPFTFSGNPSEIDGSIVAENTGGDLAGNSFTGTFNLIGDGSGGLTDSSNILGDGAQDPIDPMLAPLGDYGGPTQTMPPLPGSPAIGASALFDDQNDNLITTDQRGLALPAESPDMGAVEAIGVPKGLSLSVFSPTQINLAWTDTSSVAVNDIIYESTDSGATFTPIDQVTANGAGSANNYEATGLVPDADYQFYIVADAGVAQSTPSAGQDQSIPFETPTLDVEGTGTVVEGEPYELDLSTDFPDGEADAVTQWSVDWNDGPDGGSNVVNYPVPADFDASQPFVVMHTFAAGTASPNVTVSATDGVNGTWTADPQAVTVTPISPTLGSVSASGSSVTVNWSNSSTLSTGTTVLLSTDGTNYFEYGSAAISATSDTITGLNLHSQYWAQVITESVNGESLPSTSRSVNTPNIAPTLSDVAPFPATQGQQYTLDLSATYAPGTLQSDMIASWSVDWGDGNGPQIYSQAAGVFTSPSDISTSTSQVKVTATQANGTVTTVSDQSVSFATPESADNVTTADPDGYVIEIDRGVIVGGEEDLPVSYNGDAGTTLTYYSNNTAAMQVVGSSNIDGVRTVRVEGMSYNGADIWASDGLGDIGDSGWFMPDVPGVSYYNNTNAGVDAVTQGQASDGSVGFNFGLDGLTSVTPVTINYNTSGSTLPSSLMGSLGSGGVTVPAGDSSLNVPFAVPDDGKIAPTRAMVINLLPTGNMFGIGGQTALINVVNTDKPIVTMGAATGGGSQLSDNAVIPLDPQGDNSKLTDIHLNTGQVDGTIVSWSLTWKTSDFLMWPSNTIGLAGINDLASINVGSTLYGGQFNSVSGTETFTWFGSPPKDVYGQCMTGSSNWDTTEVDFSITVTKPATPPFVSQSSNPSSSAKGTANGAELLWGSKVVTNLFAGDMIIGQGTSLSVIWAGPGAGELGDSAWWSAQDGIGGYDNNGGAPTPFHFDPTNPAVHFYWGPMGMNGDGVGETVTCSGTIDGNSFSVATHFNIYTPGWTFTKIGVGKPTFIANGSKVKLIGATLQLPNAGIVYTASVSGANLPSDIDIPNAQWSFLQLINPARFWNTKVGNFAEWKPGVEGLDGSNPYGFLDLATMQEAATPYSSIDGSVHLTADSPELSVFPQPLNGAVINTASFAFYDSFTLFLMFNLGTSATGDSINVPLALATWRWGGGWEFNQQGAQIPTVKASASADVPIATREFPRWTYVVNPNDIRKV